jgi:NADPH:quinone reductase
MCDGWWPDKNGPRLPLVLGTDGSGTIVAVGSRVRRFAPGDPVYAYSFANPKGGFYAEYVAVDVDKVGRPPTVLSMREAGAIPATGLTALQGIDDVLRVAHGNSMVIHGASGGVGSLALQFAKMRGARVLATASGKDGIAFVRGLGADAAADGGRDNLRAAAEAFAPDGGRCGPGAGWRHATHATARRGAERRARGLSERRRTCPAQTAGPLRRVI